MQNIDDDYFSLLQWNAEFQEWYGSLILSPHGEVGLELPLEYGESDEVRNHIHKTTRIIERDELDFRNKAADELFSDGSHLFYWPEDQPFKRDEFVQQMHLALISFEMGFSEPEILLGYEYGEGVEHGIVVFLAWDGTYRLGRVF